MAIPRAACPNFISERLRVMAFRSGWFLVVVLILCGTVRGQDIVAHRGASHDAPENTISAFRLAWEMKADAIEADFYLTADKQIVCIHDKTTKRVAPESPELTVADTTLEVLRTLDVGRWKDARFANERIPTMQEVLATVPDGKRIFVEIKCGPEIIEPLKQQLTASGLKPEQIVIICFQQNVVLESRRVMPQYKANWLTGYNQKKGETDWTPTQANVLQALQATGATGLGSNGNLKVINSAFVDAVRSAGHEFHVWTVNDAAAAREFQKLKVDSITTDRPDLIRSTLGFNGPASVK